MSNPSPVNSVPLENRYQLVEILEKGSKPTSEWRIGTELEMFGFALPGTDETPFSPPPYQNGIGSLLEKFESAQWGSPIYDEEGDKPTIIGLSGLGKEKGKAISLEPAGQFELSGAPLKDLLETEKELTTHFQNVHKFGEEIGYGFSPIGFQPLWKREEMPWMPKARYKIMRQYMPKVGSLGLDMMTRTCTVQVNLDFSSEQDMCKKMRVALALQPVATAIFANSPFKEGKLADCQTMRGKIWLDTDRARSGQPESFFHESFSFESYIDWALKTPMYFIRRDGKSLDVTGASFLSWMEGKATGVLADYTPTIGDFEDHLTTLFPDVRLKTFLEMRGADAGSPEMTLGLSAFWVGLLYHQDVLDEVDELVRSYPIETFKKLHKIVPEKGIHSPFQGGFQPFLKTLCRLSEKGLKLRNLGEEKLLQPVINIVETNISQADHWISRFNGEWAGDVKNLFLESRI
ncbi:glutamate--cysteine ligase [Acetobacteraceae bacterium]|nr:glutamate--cysteine ligase [Acetobacteraceae bacterium]